VRLDEYCQAQGVPACALIKIDVESAEAAVLAGLGGTLARTPPRAVLCETHPGSDADRALRGVGFERYGIETPPPDVDLASGEGWLNILYLRSDAAPTLADRLAAAGVRHWKLR
jgi:hypothetical protein